MPIAFDNLAKFFLAGCVLGLLTPMLTPLIEGRSLLFLWLVDLVSHWQWLSGTGIVLFSVYLARCNYHWLICLILLPLPLLTSKLPTYALTQAGSSTNTIKIASANVYFKNQNPTKVINWLKAAKPDVVIITEITPLLADALDAMDDYPNQIIEPELGSFGIALLTKFPITSSVVVRDDDNIPHIEAYLKTPQQKFVVIAFHPMPPIDRDFHAKRDGKIRTLARSFSEENLPTVFAGDFNATPWSVAFQPLAELGWRRATSLLPSWPAWGQGIIGIPIDHVLVTRQWQVVTNEVGPNIDSDHFPVLTTLTIPFKASNGKPISH